MSLGDTVVKSGETKTIDSGETVSTNDVLVAGEILNAGTLQSGQVFIESASTATDIDNSKSTNKRERLGRTFRFEDLNVLSGGTKTINAGETSTFETVQTSGEVLNAGTVEVGNSVKSGDIDQTSVFGVQDRQSKTVATDTDTSIISGRRIRVASFEASDIDNSTSLSDRVRRATASSLDTDTSNSTSFYLPVTRLNDPAEAIKEVLNKSSLLVWDLDSPSSKLLQETSQSERGPGQGQPAEFYIWANDGSLEAFDAECSHFDATVDVDIWIVTLEDGKIGTDNRVYKNDTIQFLSEYMNDNESNTPFHRIRPSSQDDQRAEHITGTTDHHASVVTVSMREFRETGL